ncbi:MAG: hypothetical protein IME99_07920 [Proteobacteria bacterium]|nr:hypothetical protein [Pseudomonadota bacterium]
MGRLGIPVLSFVLLLLLGLSVPSAFAGDGSETPKADTALKKEKPPLVITSKTLEADNKKGIVIFKGNVIAEEEFLLCSDELYLGYGDGTKVDSMVAIGDVRIVHGDRVSGANRAEYKRAGRTLILTGSAVVVECGDTVRGERIEVYLDEDRVVVDGGGTGEGDGTEASGRVRAVILPQEQKSCTEAKVTGAASSEYKRGTDGESRCGWARQVLR